MTDYERLARLKSVSQVILSFRAVFFGGVTLFSHGFCREMPSL